MDADLPEDLPAAPSRADKVHAALEPLRRMGGVYVSVAASILAAVVAAFEHDPDAKPEDLPEPRDETHDSIDASTGLKTGAAVVVVNTVSGTEAQTDLYEKPAPTAEGPIGGNSPVTDDPIGAAQTATARQALYE